MPKFIPAGRDRQSFAGIREIVNIFKQGDFATRSSFLIMGFGCIKRKQYIKGLLYLIIQVAFIAYMLGFANQYLSKISTLGTEAMRREWSEARQIYVRTTGDNSMLILLFSVMSILLIIAFVFIWRANIRSCYKAQQYEKLGKLQPTFKAEIKTLLNERFHITMLTVPSLMIVAFTILPIIFMILIAFTNFDANHQPREAIYMGWV